MEKLDGVSPFVIVAGLEFMCLVGIIVLGLIGQKIPEALTHAVSTLTGAIVGMMLGNNKEK